MSDFVIIPDASSDLTKELRERFHIPGYVPGTIYFPDGSEHVADLDWKLTVHSAARAPYTLTSSQYARRTTWLPLIVAAPFFNVEDSATDITQRTVRYFLHETLNK